MLLHVQNVRKQFEHTAVLKDVSLSVDQGDVVVILGPSGSGKTTLLRCLNFLERADGGAMDFHGAHLSLAGASNKEVANVRKKTGFVFQNYNLFANKTALENVTLGLTVGRGVPKEEARAAAMEALRKVGMESRADYYPAQLSGGQQQRVGIARALAASPTILLMDEPFGAVDEITRAELQDEIRRIHRETSITILFVTHDIREALLLGTRVLVIEAGRIGQYAAPDELRRAPATEFAARLVGR